MSDQSQTAYDRLMAETIPTRPDAPPPPIRPWTPEEQAQHWADLQAAISGWHWEDDTSLSAKRRHLRLIRQSEAA
ncbi:hypothetical protein ACFY0F_23725 [Streptomyces sp. NPDC001544]|uniref:hypothetical protein n=1 Tax=Streptomyces sp. NPDC001544 TaxID=3364584 RepID=UPI0036C6D8A6